MALRILIIPDLKLVACPQERSSELDEFREHWATFLRHDDIINELQTRFASLKEEYGYLCEVSWALSEDLRDFLLAYESPWTLINEVGWVRDVMISFPGPLSQALLLEAVELSPYLTIQPNILPSYVQPETKEAWKELMWECLRQEEASRVRVASFPEQEEASIEILVEDELKGIVKLLRELADWDGVQIQIDPWFKDGLPATGHMPYHPPKQWHPSQPFPTGSTLRGPGFVDKQGWTWVWDKQEKHWDVQERRQGHGKYIRLTPDGRMLDA